MHHAVVPGTLRDTLADRWHSTRDMPGLAGLVPELREQTFYHRWFFAHWTAQFDLAAIGVLAALATRRKFWLLATVPYLERVYGEATAYRAGTQSGGEGLRRAAVHASGAPVVSAATLAGFIAGTVEWRQLVL